MCFTIGVQFGERRAAKPGRFPIVAVGQSTIVMYVAMIFNDSSGPPDQLNTCTGEL